LRDLVETQARRLSLELRRFREDSRATTAELACVSGGLQRKIHPSPAKTTFDQPRNTPHQWEITTVAPRTTRETPRNGRAPTGKHRPILI
jgi:hypothetical protein